MKKPAEGPILRVSAACFRTLTAANGKYSTTRLTLSPAGDDLTLSFAEALIDAEHIGQGDMPGYLSISFSSTDYVGHLFGPSSVEAEDNLLRLDRTLAELFAFVYKRVGLKDVVIVLPADHGAPEAPGYLNTLGISTKFITPGEWEKELPIASLKQNFGIKKNLINAYEPPYVYLNRLAIQERGLDLAVVEKAVAEEIAKFDGVALTISSKAIEGGNVPNTPIIQTIQRNYNARRSGDIYIVFDAQRFINESDGLIVASTHGSPWSYDTYVSAVFAGGRLTADRVYRPIETVDIAPTLAALVGAKPPSGAWSGP